MGASAGLCEPYNWKVFPKEVLMSQAVDRFVKQNEERFLEELKELIRIPGISKCGQARSTPE